MTDPGTAGAKTYRIFRDHLGSVRLVVDASSGVVAQEITYDAWGNAVVTGPEPDLVPFGYAGGLYDRDTGLVRFGARDYDPAVGRWTARDPIGFGGGDVNLYAYVGGDPVNGVDPSGLAWTSCGDSPEACLAIIAAGGGGLSSAASQVGNWIARDPAGAANALQSAASCPAQIAEAVGDLFSSGPGERAAPRLLGSGRLADHHIFPQQFRKFFSSKGIAIDDFTITVGHNTTHLKGIHGSGLGGLPGGWNARWAAFIRTNPTTEEIYQFAGRLMDEYGLGHLPIHPY